MLRYWWLWTLAIAIVFGVSAGLNFLGMLIFVTLTIVTALEMGSLAAKIKDGKFVDCLQETVVSAVCFWILVKTMGWLVAIAAIAVALLGLYLFCKHMAKKG